MMVLATVSITIIGILVGTVLRGLTIMLLWNWFVVTSIGLPELTMVPAMGLGLLLAYVNVHQPDKGADTLEEYYEKLGKSFGFMVSYSGIMILVGWFIHLLM